MHRSACGCCGQVLKVLEGHTDTVRAVAISADGAKIVSGSFDKTVRVWSMETGEVPVWGYELYVLLLHHPRLLWIA